jgi:hypothetical protein
VLQRVVIPNECEGSKISPWGRNDRDGDGDALPDCDTVCGGKDKGEGAIMPPHPFLLPPRGEENMHLRMNPITQ